MARVESKAIGGYFKTPIDQIYRIAGLLSFVKNGKTELTAMDPCAGEGEAIETLLREIGAVDSSGRLDASTYTCELEKTRYDELHKRLVGGYGYRNKVLGGDAFHIKFTKDDGIGLLFLNPPYDVDRQTKRLEEKFLARFAPSMKAGGVLVYILPHYAVQYSAQTLGKMFEDVSCWKFSGSVFDAFKQVVIFAKRREVDLPSPDSQVVEQCQRWANSVADIRELPERGTHVTVMSVPSADTWSSRGLNLWEVHKLDVNELLTKFAPWHETTRARGLTQLVRVIPDIQITKVMQRTYEVATPPRPAHIAAGLAAGLFNGARIEPDDLTLGLPTLLVKGVFDRDWRTVEEKLNKDGDVASVVQVQQPRLVVTVLDLKSSKYYTIGSSIEETGEKDISRMSVPDLLKNYGTALMRVMEEQCKILYDPRKDADTIKIVEPARPLFQAQAHAVKGCVKLLRDRFGRQPFLLGEIGSGKSVVALTAARTHGSKRALVLCPPHLIDSWKNETRSAFPDAEFVTLQTLKDFESIKNISASRMMVAVMSREAAKLGHGWDPVGEVCPKCGENTPEGVDLAKKRERCEVVSVKPKDNIARLARELALYLRPWALGDPIVQTVLQGRIEKSKAPVGLEYKGLPYELMVRIRSELASRYVDHVFQQTTMENDLRRAIVLAFSIDTDVDHLIKFVGMTRDSDDWSHFSDDLLALIPPDNSDGISTALALAESWIGRGAYYAKKPVDRLKDLQQEIKEEYGIAIGGIAARYRGDTLWLDAMPVSSPKTVVRLLSFLAKLGNWTKSSPCGEPLYQAVPQPRRMALAKYVVSHHSKTFDFLILDEGHEYATDGSAQERAAHRLTALGLPTILMTGSVMNGYARSLYANMWALTKEFRDEFDKDELSAFVDRYGYRKRVLQDKEEGKVVAYGSQSDRVRRSERDAGDAPGILPLFLFRHLLPSAVTIHKSDLRINLPPLSQESVGVPVEGELLEEYYKLLLALRNQIKQDMFVKERAGKLFGALSELPSYLDRATLDVGNVAGSKEFEIRYPETLGRQYVVGAKLFSEDTLLPKESMLLNFIHEELMEKRNVMVFGWHLETLPRLARLISKKIGEPVPILRADKVPTAKRQTWIDKEIVRNQVKVMVTNPIAIQTGLNNLVHFSSEWWHESPACNPITYRQAIGRIDRIGQKLPTRVRYAYYANTLQEKVRDLLLTKVAISTASDGLDPESALRAAGIVEDDMLTGLSIGKQLYAMLEQEMDRLTV